MKKLRFLKLNIKEFKPDLFFITFALFFGLIILLLTPPFQTPDEINHFYKAYQISEGNLISVKQNYRVGGYIPISLVKITEPFLGLSWNMHAKTNHKTIFEQFKTPLNEKEKKFVDFPITGMYSPISYFPQSVSIFVLRKLNLPPLYLFYGARIFTLLFWVFSIFYAIKIIPFYKWFFALIALLPMSLFINMSLSADVVTNLLSFILIAYILKLAYSEQAISSKNFIITSLIVILLASAKLVYTPIILLFLLIPKEKFYNKRTYYIQLIALFIISFGTVLFWSKIMNNLYLPYSMYNTQFRDSATLIKCADMHEQMQYILNHGLYIWHVFINSMTHTFDMYFQGYIGTFGWLDTKLPMWFIYLSYVILFIVAFADECKGISFKINHKIILFVSLIIITSLILLSQHLTWDCVGGDIIATIQGRYFIPSFPLLFMLFYNSKFNNSKIVIPVVIVFSFISLSFTINTLYTRYYITPKFESVTIKCDAENIARDNFFATNISSVFLENAHTQSREKARSGMFSAKLTPKNQFGFTYRLYNCGIGDIIKVEVWRFGTTGSIIISGGTNDFYIDEANPVEKDSAGWEHLQLSFTVPKNMNNKEIGICLFYYCNDSSYFDDMIISYDKLQ